MSPKAMASLGIVVLTAVLSRAASETRGTREFWTTGEAGDNDGYECLACPTQEAEAYIQNPNDHHGPLSEAELFVLQYWSAMSRGDVKWVVDMYSGGGVLIRAGGPPMGGPRLSPVGTRTPIDPALGYEANSEKGGAIAWLYTSFLGMVTFRGRGGMFSTVNGTDGLHVAIQDTIQISEDFAIVTAMVKGTVYGTGKNPNPYALMAQAQSFKTTVTVRKFPGLGWRIVQFTCTFFNFDFVPGGGSCIDGPSSGIPAPHVDWTANWEYAVKHTDQANYCSKKCLCGEAPVKASPSCNRDVIPKTLPYRNNVFVTSEKGVLPGSLCFPCPIAGFVPTFPRNSPEQFAINFVKDLGAGKTTVLQHYSDHAIIVRNGGPMITSPTGNGGEFFTNFWPGLVFEGTGGAMSELLVTVQRSQRIGHNFGQVLLFTNGTLYKADGTVAVPWLAKKISLSVTVEASAWKVVSLDILDFNTQGVSKCTHDGTGDYCSGTCLCGESPVMLGAEAKAEDTSYHPAQMPAASPSTVGQRVRKHSPLRRHMHLSQEEGDSTAMLQLPGDTEEL